MCSIGIRRRYGKRNRFCVLFLIALCFSVVFISGCEKSDRLKKENERLKTEVEKNRALKLKIIERKRTLDEEIRALESEVKYYRRRTLNEKTFSKCENPLIFDDGPTVIFPTLNALKTYIDTTPSFPSSSTFDEERYRRKAYVHDSVGALATKLDPPVKLRLIGYGDFVADYKRRVYLKVEVLEGRDKGLEGFVFACYSDEVDRDKLKWYMGTPNRRTPKGGDFENARIPTKIVITDEAGCELRVAPSLDADFIEMVPFKAECQVNNRHKGWFRIKTLSGLIGWLSGYGEVTGKVYIREIH